MNRVSTPNNGVLVHDSDYWPFIGMHHSRDGSDRNTSKLVVVYSLNVDRSIGRRNNFNILPRNSTIRASIDLRCSLFDARRGDRVRDVGHFCFSWVCLFQVSTPPFSFET
jgi:hypothetical protein